MSLRTTFTRLYKEAEARQTSERPGEAFASLDKGADIRVRVQGRRRQVILGRQRVHVSDHEIATFREHGRIPPEAEQRTWPKTAKGWCYVDLQWEAPPSMFEGMPQAELPESLSKPPEARAPQQDAEGGA